MVEPSGWRISYPTNWKQSNVRRPSQNQTQAPKNMGIILTLLYIAAVIYVLTLLARFVGAHERMATSLDIIARKLKDDGKP